jgi:hypothetical protein
MQLSFRNLAFVLVLLFGLLWWMLGGDPEAEIRAAHTQLREQIVKTDDETAPALLLKARALADLFADPIEVSGSAEGMAGIYSPEELGNLIVRLRTVFDTIELTFSELVIEFPSDENAIVRFSAALNGRTRIAGDQGRLERRSVTTRLRLTGGDWLFTEIELAGE